MHHQEPLDQLAEGDLGGIIGDLDSLSMACVAVTDLIVSRILDRALLVATLSRDDSRSNLEGVLNPPEASAREVSNLCALSLLHGYKTG